MTKLLTTSKATSEVTFDERWTPLRPKLFEVARKMTNGSSHDAEDLVQETALACCAAYGRYRADCPFENWVFYVMANKWKDMVKYKRFFGYRTTELYVESDFAEADSVERRTVNRAVIAEAMAYATPEVRRVLELLTFNEGPEGDFGSRNKELQAAQEFGLTHLQLHMRLCRFRNLVSNHVWNAV